MPRRFWSAASMVLSIFCVVIGTNIVNVALPALSAIHAAEAARVIWLVNGFQIAVVVSLLGFSALGRRIGHRALFQLGVALFTAGAVGCAVAPDFDWMIAARILQGFGASATLCIVGALVRDIYPPALTGHAVALTSFTVALSAGASPILGSTLLTFASWPWLFLVIAPLGIATLACSLALPANRRDRQSVDWLGCLLGGTGLGLFVFGIKEIGTDNLVSAGCISAAMLCASTLLRHSRRSKNPVLPLDLLAGQRLRFAATASVLCFSGNMIVLTTLPFFLIVDLGLLEIEAGALMSIWPFTVMAAAVVAGGLATRLKEELLCATGSAMMIVGIGSLCWASLAAVLPVAIGGVALTAFGFGLFQGPNNRILLLKAPIERAAGAAVIQATARELGNASGAGLVAAVFAIGCWQTTPVAFMLALALSVLTAATNLRRLPA